MFFQGSDIMKYFTTLIILTPENPPRDPWHIPKPSQMHPLMLHFIS